MKDNISTAYYKADSHQNSKEFESEKLFDGYSTVFRQWRAEGTHCKFLHGYGVSFKVTYIGKLDHRNWNFDHGGFKRSPTLIDGMQAKDWVDFILDHTVILAQDDPELESFKELAEKGVMQLRVIPNVGTERFAEFLFQKIDDFVIRDTNGRVRVKEIQFKEHEKNSSTFNEYMLDNEVFGERQQKIFNYQRSEI